MYRLSCSDITNDESMSLVFKQPDKVKQIKEKASMEKISHLIFNENICDKLHQTLALSLTVSDDLKLPMHEKIAKILFFALCVNSDNSINFKVKNLTQALTLYELYENDYKSIEIEDDERNLKFTTLDCQHLNIIKDFLIQWKIPVGYFLAGGKRNVTLSGSAYCIVLIHGIEYKVPRVLFIKFFKNSLVNGRLICSSTDEIKSNFDQNNSEALQQVLEYIGYQKDIKYENIAIPQKDFFVEDNVIFCVGLNKVNETFWITASENKYLLLPFVKYIPLKGKDENSVTLMV